VASTWAWMSALQKGTSHEKTGTRLQDALTVSSVKVGEVDWIYAVISDGAGSAQYGGEGASIICRTISTCIRNHFSSISEIPSIEVIESWLDMARDRISYAASRRGLTSRDFAGTLLLIISNGFETFSVHVGDGSIVVQDELSGEWYCMSWPNHGEYASMTYFLTDEIQINVRYSQTSLPIKSLAIFSDGLERLALEFSKKTPFPAFFNALAKPLNDSKLTGKNFSLSKALKTYLNSDAVNSRTDDDKSLIFAVRK
jgi:hypothetical protein